MFLGKIVIVIGVGGGLGFVIVMLFVRLGVNLVINGCNEEKFVLVVEFLCDFGGKVFVVLMLI